MPLMANLKEVHIWELQLQLWCNLADTLCPKAPCCAERVKVVVRLRPPFAHETGGAVTVNKEQSSISVFRE